MVQSIWMLCNWYAELDWFSLATLLPVSAQFARDGRNIFPRHPSSPHTLRKDNFFNFGANFLNFGATMTTVTKTDTDTFSWFLVLNASWHVLDTQKKPGGNPVRICSPPSSLRRKSRWPNAGSRINFSTTFFFWKVIQVISSEKFFSAEEVDRSFNSETKEHPQISNPSFRKRDRENIFL